MTDLPFRIGQAVDVHAFAAPDSPRPLMVACLEWPGERPLEGHSDADVAAHALCDAMLLATGLPGACAVMSEIAGGTVTVSATTSDRLGFTGRGEGVAALASALMVRAE